MNSRYINIVENTEKEKKNICRIIVQIVTISIVVLVLAFAIIHNLYTYYNGKIKCVRSTTELTSYEQQDYRFSFKISKNQYVYYSGNKIWKEWSQNKILEQDLIEIGRNNQSVIVSVSNKPIALSSLCKTYSNPQPIWNEARWQSVWASNDSETFFYPQSNTIWFELKYDEVFAAHTFVKQIGQTVVLEKNSDGHIIKLNNSGMYGGYQIENLILYSFGNWIH